MNKPISPESIEDVQSTPDKRQLDIDQVGIKSIKHPIIVKDKTGGAQHTVANFNMYVHLPHNFKGTHMSRFVEILNENDKELSVESFEGILRAMLKKLESVSCNLEMVFPYFIKKTAPISGVKSVLDYEVSFFGKIINGSYTNTTKVVVPVTSLCPCSKKISDYGAHNQRSHVTVTIEANDFIWIEDIINIVEKQASSELYGLLKRVDEKYVTEKAYNNPKFVEDMVRDIAQDLKAHKKINTFIVESENFESIHNHSAYALIKGNNN